MRLPRAAPNGHPRQIADPDYEAGFAGAVPWGADAITAIRANRSPTLIQRVELEVVGVLGRIGMIGCSKVQGILFTWT